MELGENKPGLLCRCNDWNVSTRRFNDETRFARGKEEALLGRVLPWIRTVMTGGTRLLVIATLPVLVKFRVGMYEMRWRVLCEGEARGTGAGPSGCQGGMRKAGS